MRSPEDADLDVTVLVPVLDEAPTVEELSRRAPEVRVVRRTGNHYLRQLTAARRGAILLGAHVGSFEAMDSRIP